MATTDDIAPVESLSSKRIATTRVVHHEKPKHIILVNGLAFGVGWTNVMCLLKYRTFGTMMTGNTIWLAQSIVRRRWTDMGFYIAVILSFCFGNLLFRAVNFLLRIPRAATRLAPVCVVLTVAQDAVIASRWAVLLLSGVLGLVTALANDYDGVVCNMVTGHIARCADAIFQSTTVGLSKKERQLARASATVLLTFCLGVSCATVLVLRHSLDKPKPFQPPIFSPLGLVFAALLLLHDSHIQDLRQTAPPALMTCFKAAAKTPGRIFDFSKHHLRRSHRARAPSPSDHQRDLEDQQPSGLETKSSSSSSENFARKEPQEVNV